MRRVMYIFAEGELVPGSAGWVGAGMLGLVLGWLFFKHLPEKDRQMRDLIEAFIVKLAEERAANEHWRNEAVSRLDRIDIALVEQHNGIDRLIVQLGGPSGIIKKYPGPDIIQS